MTVLAVIMMIIFLSTATTVIVKSIIFEQQCKGYLKRAADANTIKIATSQLKIAIDYAEKK